jgi:CBS domain-containing protein
MEFRSGQAMSSDEAEVANGIWQEALFDRLADWWDQHPSATQSKIQAQIDALTLLDLDVLFGNKTADIIPFPVVKQPPNEEHPSVVRDRPIKIMDATFRIGRLPCANKPPTCVAPNGSIIEAITIMMHNDFSQLPVMVGERVVKGAVSWRSIGARLANGASLTGEVRDFMDQFPDMRRVLSTDATLLEAVDAIVKYEYVLVIDQEKRISGIVTLTDVSVIFRELSTPFIRLEEIEKHIRNIISLGEFSRDELQSACDPRDDKRQVNRVTDLTFGEYVRLLQRPESWQRLNLAVDRIYFIGELDKIKNIRNDVMHFDPDGIPDETLRGLEKFVDFLQRLPRKSTRQ